MVQQGHERLKKRHDPIDMPMFKYNHFLCKHKHFMEPVKPFFFSPTVQAQMDDHLKLMSEFLATEERRAGIYLTEPVEDTDDSKPAVTEQEVWTKVQTTLKRSQAQMTRCQAVIKKLHADCETVAKQNADIVEQTKECDAKIKDVLSVGRHSAKHNSVPKKTQDLFAHLMDDIEKLVKSRRKVLDKETEGRRHSTRIVRQCRDWVEGRTVALQKLAANPAPGAFRSLEAPGDGELTVNIKRAAPKNDNGILSILDSLQLLEHELQEYIHREITVTDKYRSELRHKHLQKRVHGFGIHGLSDVESALESLEKDPENFKDNLVIVKTCISEINREYAECVSFLNRVEPGNSNEANAAQSSPQAARRDFKQTSRDFRKVANMGGKIPRSTDNGIKDRSERNQLLERIKAFIVRHEELKSEDHVVGNKYRAEMSKKKRETDIIIQRKDDQILRLQTEVKEAHAEKDKYRKLYNDTKIGVQRNFETFSDR